MSLTSVRMLHMLSVLLLQLLLFQHSLCAVPHLESDFDLSCSSDFRLFNSFCYRYFIAKRPFHSAEKSCSRYGSSLVSIHTTEEEEFVVQLTENNSAFWIGLNDQDGPDTGHTEGVFKWTDGNSFSERESYQSWKLGQPDNHRHLDCVKADHSGWSMANGGCATPRLPFLCKRRACPTDLEWNGNSCQATSSPSLLHSTEQPTRLPTAHTALPAASLVILALLALGLLWWHRRTDLQQPTHTLLEHGIQDVR